MRQVKVNEGPGSIDTGGGGGKNEAKNLLTTKRGANTFFRQTQSMHPVSLEEKRLNEKDKEY